MKIILFVLLPLGLFAQYNPLPLHSDIYKLAQRLEIKKNSDIHTSVNSFSAEEIFKHTIQVYDSLSTSDKFIAAKLIRSYPEYWHYIRPDDRGTIEYIDSTKTFYTGSKVETSDLNNVIKPKTPVLKYFYENRNYFAQIKAKNFLFKVNPVLFFGGGRDFGDGDFTFENRRGIIMNGHINNRVFFYSDILESQARFLPHVVNFEKKFQTIPGNGFYKFYNSSVIERLRGYDFLNARAFVNVPVTANVGFEFGNGKHFLGNGRRSLLLSDFTNNYLYAKINTKIWKLHYQNIFAELIPISPRLNPPGTIIPRKYMATHYLSFKHKSFEIGLFESVIFERDGSFDLQYLNPVILYRLVEYNLDSSDNVLIGINGKVNVFRTLQLYGQILFDEFLLSELILEPRGWWANKYGIQAGLKYIDALGIESLDVQLEFNRVRPYTYGHRSMASYSHAQQSLAHPLGGNFSEVNLNASYYLSPKLKISSDNYLMLQGLDTPEILFGADVLRPSSERPGDFENFHLQGESSRTIYSVNQVSYEIMPNYFFDLNLIYRNQVSDIETLNFNNVLLSGAVRINFWEPSLAF